MATTEVDLYLRLSEDKTGEEAGVERQETECRAYCAERGWTVREVFIDNDISATKGALRPRFEALLVARSAAIVVWHIDRLVRVSKDLERVIELAVNVYAVRSGHVDLSNPAGRAVARTVTAWATYEGEQKAERQKSAARQRARQGGSWWSTRPFGFERDGRLRKTEAAGLQRAYSDLLAGVSLKQLARDLTTSGHLTCRGKVWTATALRPVLLNARNTAIRVYDGEEIGPASWEAIVPEDTYRAAVRLLTDPDRSTGGGGPRRFLLTGIAVCGKCGGGVKGAARQRTTLSPRYEVYVCKKSSCVSHRMEFVDMLIGEEVIEWLRVHGQDVLAEDEGSDLEAMRTKAVRLREKLVELRGDYDDDIITRGEFRESSQRLRERLEVAEAALVRVGAAKPLEGLLDPEEIASGWDALDLERRRGVIEVLGVSVRLNQRGRGRREMRLEDVTVTFPGHAESPTAA